MRAGARRYAARDLSTIQHDDMRAFDGKFIGRGNPGNTCADDDDIAFLVALKRCGARGWRDAHPKALAAPFDEMTHLKIQPVENEVESQTADRMTRSNGYCGIRPDPSAHARIWRRQVLRFSGRCRNRRTRRSLASSRT